MNLYDTWLIKKPLSHRGMFNDEFPENTLGAFQNAVDHNFGCELDVQMTTDGQLVVFHDYDMKRLTGVPGDIREKSFSEIKNLKIHNTKYGIPTFEEVLNLIDGRIPILVEVKHHKHIGKMEIKIRDLLRKYKGQYAIESFNPFIVKWFYKNAPEMVRGQLSCAFEGDDLPNYQKKILRALLFVKSNHSQFLAYDVDDIIANKKVLKLKKKMPSLDDFISQKFEISDDMVKDFIALAQKDNVASDSLETLRTNQMFKMHLKAYLANDLYENGAFTRIMNQTNEAFLKALDVLAEENKYRNILENTEKK